MANEFKIKKGLIVTGASGGTVVDIQGSQGQLFSVTDDLSGSIFAVSDISGVPIFDVNSSGVSYFDGSLGIGTDSPNSKLHVLDGAAGTYTPYGESDTLVVESATPGGISLIGTGTGSLSKQSIVFGTTSDVTSATIIYDSNNSVLSIGTTTASNYVRFVSGNGTTALTLDASQDATFTGDVLAPRFDIGTDSTSIIQETNRMKFTNSIANDAGGFDFYTRKTDSSYVNALQILGTGDSTFAAQAFSAATSSGDGSSTLTTKGYVDGLITGATIYRGAWDPSGGGYGSPDLSGVTQTSGYYYICSAAGTAEPNGTGCEPDSWETGDWVIWNDDIVDCAGTGTGGWQKIDNSSVLSGVGTGQTVALWEGAGSVTDSETLGNAPITVSGSDTAFAGNITAYTGGGSGSLGVGRTSNQSIKLYISDTNNSITAEQDSDGNSAHKFILNRVFDGTGANDFKIQKGGTDQFTLDTSANATFAGTITGQNIYGNQFVDAQDNAYYANPAMTSVMKGATFDGDVTVTTQAVGDDSTLVATTEYADRAAANVPIGNYLPLSAGSGFPLTGDLYVGTSTAATDRFIRAYYSDNNYTEVRGYGIITNRAGSYYRPANDKTQVLAIGNDGNTWNYVSQNANYHTFGKDTSEWMRIDTSGNVGINATSNSAGDTNNGVPKLQVNTATAVLGEFPLAARFTTNSDAGDNSGVSVLINSGNDRGLMISAGRQTGNVSKVTLNVVKNDGDEIDTITLLQDGQSGSSANVGIGTTSPDYPLDVSGLTRSSSGFSADGNARIVNWEGSNTAGTAAIKLIATYSNVAQGDRIKIEAVGNIGYGAGTDTVVSTIALQMNSNNLLEGSWWQEGGDYSAFSTTGGASVFVRTVATGTYQIYVRTGTYSAFAFTASCNSGTIVPSWTTIQSSIPNTNAIDNKWSLNQAIYENNGNVGIGAVSPKAKLDINGHFCVDSKTHSITDAFTTCLTVNLTSHTGCHVVITAFGDWGSHSSAAYRGEFFLQNGANGYSEPGIILRQDDNTSDGTDQIICQIVDNPSTANPKDFQIQIRHTDTTSPASFDAQLTYTVQGKFNSIT